MRGTLYYSLVIEILSREIHRLCYLALNSTSGQWALINLHYDKCALNGKTHCCLFRPKFKSKWVYYIIWLYLIGVCYITLLMVLNTSCSVNNGIYIPSFLEAAEGESQRGVFWEWHMVDFTRGGKQQWFLCKGREHNGNKVR